eukprot:5627354-Prymnesium_polylepis.2
MMSCGPYDSRSCRSIGSRRMRKLCLPSLDESTLCPICSLKVATPWMATTCAQQPEASRNGSPCGWSARDRAQGGLFTAAALSRYVSKPKRRKRKEKEEEAHLRLSEQQILPLHRLDRAAVLVEQHRLRRRGGGVGEASVSSV